MAHGQDYKIHPDGVLILAGFLIVSILLYHFPPVKIKIYGVRAYLYSIESYMILKFDDAQLMKKVGDFTTKAPVKVIRSINVDKISKIFDEFYKKNRFRLFLICIIPNFLCLYVLYTLRKDCLSWRGNFDFKWLIAEKYGLEEVLRERNNVKKVYQILCSKKEKMNIPVNLVARLYPKDSPERTFIYKGSYDYIVDEVKISADN